jgi:hypothetical protein
MNSIELAIRGLRPPKANPVVWTNNKFIRM